MNKCSKPNPHPPLFRRPCAGGWEQILRQGEASYPNFGGTSMHFHDFGEETRYSIVQHPGWGV